MPSNKPDSVSKPTLHPRNKHNQDYDFDVLIETLPRLSEYVKPNTHGKLSVNFSDPEAVKALNEALLKTDYNIKYWDIPKGYLCPPIPSRADYIHHIADLLAEGNDGNIPKASSVNVVDVGVGANCIYPIIGNSEYGWSFIGSDISKESLAVAEDIVSQNTHLKEVIILRHQPNVRRIFKDIILEEDQIAASICNPPFHASAEAAQRESARKIKNLTGETTEDAALNFGGQHNELWCKGGEQKFITDMIFESKFYKDQCTWFTTLVSKKDNVRPLKRALKKVGATAIKVIPMSTNNKTSRILVWSFIEKT